MPFRFRLGLKKSLSICEIIFDISYVRFLETSKGIDSVFSAIECCINTFEDILFHNRCTYLRKEIIAFAVCFAAFVLALPNVFEGGIYFYKLMDWYTCVQSLAILMAVEVIVVLWIYGSTNLR